MHTHGIAEPQLSLMAWRSARIINSLVGQAVFDTESGQGMIDWLSPSALVEQLVA
jgi:lysine N6-hydroxylase